MYIPAHIFVSFGEIETRDKLAAPASAAHLCDTNLGWNRGVNADSQSMFIIIV